MPKRWYQTWLPLGWAIQLIWVIPVAMLVLAGVLYPGDVQFPGHCYYLEPRPFPFSLAGPAPHEVRCP